MSEVQNLRVVVIREGDFLVAQCLEYDVCTSALDMETLEKRMQLQLECEMALSTQETGVAFQGVDPAPQEFHKMWDEGRKFETDHQGFQMALAA